MSKFLGTRRSPFIGFLIAPLAPLLALIVLATMTSGQIPEIIWGAVMVLPASYLTSLVVGGPLVYLLRIRRKSRIWHYIIVGALASLFPIFVTLIFPITFLNQPAPPDFSDWVPAHTKIAFAMALSGTLVGITFWIITRPDKWLEHKGV